jgi:hypothetical protein
MGISVVSRVICSLSVATILAVLSSGNVQAQSATAGQRVMGAGQYAPFVTQPFPPSLTPEQQRQRDEGMSRVNRPGPPLPVGPARMAPNVPPTSASTAPQTEEVGTPPAASDFVFFQATAQAPYSTGTSTIAETHAGNAGAVVFMTGNWFASYSTDGGTNFTFVNPYTEFTSLDGGFCCDQTVIYHPGYDLMIWQLLYNYSSSTQQGSYRTAFAPASSVASSGWCYYDWNPSSFGLASGQYLDYPHVAISSNYVWYSANVYTAAGSWQDTLIWRIPLSPVTSCSGFNYNWFTVDRSLQLHDDPGHRGHDVLGVAQQYELDPHLQLGREFQHDLLERCVDRQLEPDHALSMRRTGQPELVCAAVLDLRLHQ